MRTRLPPHGMMSLLASTPLKGRPGDYAVAAVLAIGALACTRASVIVREQAPFLLAVGSVMAASWLGGLGPGVLALVICVFGVDLLVREPFLQFTLMTRDFFLTSLLFVAVASSTIALNTSRLRSQSAYRTLFEEELAARNEAVSVRNSVSLLAEVSAILAESLDFEETLPRVARLLTPELADWCVVHVLSDDDSHTDLVIAHENQASVEWARDLRTRYRTGPISGRGVDSVLKSGQPTLFADVPDELLVETAQDADHLAAMRAAGMVSAMIVPIFSRGQVLGAMSFVSTRAERRFGVDDLAYSEIIARRCGQAIDNTRLYRESQASEARYRSLFTGTAEAVFVIGQDGQCLDSNASAAELLGYSTEELCGSALDSFIEPAPADLRLLDRHGTNNVGWKGQAQLRCKDGSLIPAEGQARWLELPSGPVLVMTWRDISERQELEHLQTSFLASISHDVKNPLAAASATVQLCRRRLRSSKPIDLDLLSLSLAAIEQALSRMEDLLDELADMARSGLGEPLDLIRAPIDLLTMIRRGVMEVGRGTERHQVTLRSDAEQIVGNWDGRRLQRVIDNLLSNAIKYSPNGGVVDVTARSEPDEQGRQWAVFEVSDEGIGIPAADLPLMFQRFHRGSNVTGVIRGTGMGLAGSRDSVERHGGRISVKSAEGRGSVFTVHLPLDGIPE